MKRLIILVFILNCFFLNAQSTKKDKYAVVLIYKDQEKINVYSACNKNKIVDYLLNDTVTEDYFIIKIFRTKNNRYQIAATSMQHSGIKGWIGMENIGINTRQRDFKLLLYEQPHYKAPYLIVNEEVDNRIVRVTAIISDWLKIKWVDNNEYWLPPDYQCPNPYTTCN